MHVYWTILRDTRSNCVMTASIREGDAFNPMAVKAKTILRGLQLCMHLGLSHLIIESDCKIVVDSILQREDSMSEIGNLIYDIKEWMGNFQDCKIQFIHQHCNRAAHTLARFTWTVDNIYRWYGLVPDCIVNIIRVDNIGL